MADFSWLTALGFLFLTFNSGMAVYRSNGDTGSIIFVVVSYLDLVALFACLRYYERLDRHSPKRETVKAAVWGLTTLLTVMFSYKVAEIMPLAVKLVVWAMAAATSCGGFYAFFIHEEKPALPAAGVPAAAHKEGAAN
ncbi:hypothetical protein SETIT_4G232100v2 [Setaria italica]|uniref:PGG domain-containing protein n=1 Tax=Setaria italica TaxID=4555 RepID=K3Y3E5_SETIT|nr:uncharacterized protein LOC101760134 [Setaria italica]RCV22583.1 hypothetical protein SETIT_4G232100v2 [Setaria italica]